MSSDPEIRRPATPVTERADEMLDEVILESFPASDPPASWSGLDSADLLEEPESEVDSPSE